MRDLPHNLALIQIDGGDTSVRRFYKGQSLDREATTAALSRRSSGRDGRVGAGVRSGAAAQARTLARGALNMATPCPKFSGSPGTNPKILRERCDGTYRIWVSGSYDPPTQFVPPPALGQASGWRWAHPLCSPPAA